MSVAVGATYDFTITDTYNLHRRVNHHLSVRDRRRAVAVGCLPPSQCSR